MRLNLTKALKLLQKKGLTPDEIRLWMQTNDRLQFASTFFRDRDNRPWTPRPYQADSLQSMAPRKVHCDGRDVGKTSEIELMALWAMAAMPNREMLVATQCENHLFPLMDRIVRRIETTPGFAGVAEIRRTPSWRVRTSSGFVLWGRIAGPRGVNFQGLHVDWQLIDEAQELTDPAWGELYQALNAGGKRWVYGVPNGLRNGFHRMTQDAAAEQFNWPSTLNPDYTAAKDAELARLYGGRTAPGYVHRVLGQHGAPEHAVFNLDDYLACVDPALDAPSFVVCEGDPFEAPIGVPGGAYYLGCDLGYARDPSEFVVFRADEPHFINVLRVRLEGVNFARQARIIVELDAAYAFRRIGIDAGNNGRAVAHELMSLGGDWCHKIEAIDFGASARLVPLPNGDTQRIPAKTFMTGLLQRRMAERTLVFPRLPEREEQYASHTYAVGVFGHILYTKGNDHLIDADRCALYAHYLDTHDLDQKTVPTHPNFGLGWF